MIGLRELAALIGKLEAETEAQAKATVNTVGDALDDLDTRFAGQWGWANDAQPTPVRPVPVGTAEGGATFEQEVRWALDAVKRKDFALAEARLKLILKGP